MSEWLGKSRITEEDIKKVFPSLVKYFPMLTRYYVNNQKMRISLVLSYEKGDEFKEAVNKTFGSFTPTNIRKAAEEAVDQWIKSHRR
jgi:uncharacterized protein (DUF433 family)